MRVIQTVTSEGRFGQFWASPATFKCKKEQFLLNGCEKKVECKLKISVVQILLEWHVSEYTYSLSYP